jgi:pentatricopeptide repeat protein
MSTTSRVAVTRLALCVGVAAGVCAAATARAQTDGGGPVERGKQLVQAAQFAQARELLLPYVKANPRDAAAAFWIGRAYYGDTLWRAASDWLERAAKIDERNSEYHFWYGAALGAEARRASKLKQPFLAKKVKAEFERAVALDPANLDAREGLVSFYLEAPGVMGGSAEKARQQALEVKRLNAYRGAFQVASVALRQKDTAAAEREYAAGIEAFPDSSAFYNALVTVYLQTNRVDDAFRMVERFRDRRPDDMIGQYMLGRAGAMSGQQLDRAEAALREYLHHTPGPTEPSRAAAHWRLGMIHERRGHTAQAREAYETALKLDPKHRGAREALAKLK